MEYSRGATIRQNAYCDMENPYCDTPFAKAFDKAPHRRLLHKLEYYGIRGSTHLNKLFKMAKPLFQEKIIYLAYLLRCSAYHSTHKNFVKQIHSWIFKVIII